MLRIAVPVVDQETVLFVPDLCEGMRCIDQLRFHFEMNSAIGKPRSADQPRAMTIARRRLHPIEVAGVDASRADVMRVGFREGEAGKQPQLANRVRAGQVGARVLLGETMGLCLGNSLLPGASRGDAIENVIASSVEDAGERDDAPVVGMGVGMGVDSAGAMT